MNRILFIKPGSLGDVVHALPCATAIKRARPDSELLWVVDPRWRPVLAGNPLIDRIIEFPRQSFRGTRAFHAIPWMLDLHRLRCDTALDLQGLFRSGLMSLLSGARERIGLADAREGARLAYSHIAPLPDRLHAVDRYLHALKAVDIPPPASPEFPLPPGTQPEIPLPNPFLLLHPFARGYGKSLSPEAVTAFCRTFTALPIVLAGVGHLDTPLPAHCINTLNRTTLAEMIALLRAAHAVVSVDSGPLHIAAATNPRVLGIHTWSDPRLVGPYQNTAWIWKGGTIAQRSAGHFPKGHFITPQHAQEIARWTQSQFA